MLESTFQADTIALIKHLLPGVRCLKNDPGYQQGIPDFSIFYGCAWAWLEFKKSANERPQPNQPFFIDWADKASFGAFIYPENCDEVLDELIPFLKNQNRAGRWA